MDKTEAASESSKQLIKDSLIRLRGVAIRGARDRYGYAKMVCLIFEIRMLFKSGKNLNQ